MSIELSDNHRCFACGTENPISLRLQFDITADGLLTGEFTPSDLYQGYMGYMHGGISSVILDEAMARLLLDYYHLSIMTVKMELRFRKPVDIGKKLHISAKYLSQNGKFHKVKGELRNDEGQILVSSEGLYAEVTG